MIVCCGAWAWGMSHEGHSGGITWYTGWAHTQNVVIWTVHGLSHDGQIQNMGYVTWWASRWDYLAFSLGIGFVM